MQLSEYTNIPLKTQIIKKEKEEKYTIHFQKYGNKHRGFSMEMTTEQIEKIRWWY